MYLVVVCFIPNFLIAWKNVPFYFGGTSLLIVVSVTMDTVAQVQVGEHRAEHNRGNANQRAAFRQRRVANFWIVGDERQSGQDGRPQEVHTGFAADAKRIGDIDQRLRSTTSQPLELRQRRAGTARCVCHTDRSGAP